MSFDFQIGFPCPHLIQEERVPLDSDRMGMLISQPVASTGTVQVLVDDKYLVPPSGLHTQAFLQSSLSGGYRIPKYETTLVVSSNTETHTIELPISKSISTNNLVDILNAHFKNIEATNYEGYLVFVERQSRGGESRIKITGSARQALGFDFCSTAKGKTLYPAWRMERVPNKINERYPKFVQPLKNNPILKVTYSTPAERCLRCGATYVENDFRVDSNGELQTITDENLLYQICLKALLTKKGSNPFFRFYGTGLLDAIGSKALMGVQNFLRFEINDALRIVQKAQTSQSKYQTVTQKERLLNVLNVTVIPHENDPTAFLIEVTVQNASQQPISLSIVYTAPSAVALAGTNGLSLGVR